MAFGIRRFGGWCAAGGGGGEEVWLQGPFPGVVTRSSDSSV